MKKGLIFTLALSAAMFLGLGNANAEIKAATDLECESGVYEKNGVSYDRKCTIALTTSKDSIAHGTKFNFSVQAEGVDDTAKSAFVENASSDFSVNPSSYDDITESDELEAEYIGETKEYSNLVPIAYVYFNADDAGTDGVPAEKCALNYSFIKDSTKCHIDNQKGEKTYYYDGKEVTKEEYDKLCGSNNYKDGYGNPYVIIGLGAALIAGVVFVTKKNKVFN